MKTLKNVMLGAFVAASLIGCKKLNPSLNLLQKPFKPVLITMRIFMINTLMPQVSAFWA